jgi:hypothetical protein
VLLDPTTFEALVNGLSGDGKAAHAATAGMPALPADDPNTLITPDREQILLAFGLNERDLDFMGSEQRAKVDEVVERVIAVYAFA